MPWAKKKYDKILAPHNLAMVHPTLMCLPWTINMLHNPHANIRQCNKKKKTMQQKKTMYPNVQSSSGASFLMNYDGFQSGICKRSFVRMAPNHSTKSLHVYWLVMIQTTSTFVQWKMNATNVNMWYFTSLVPNMASIKITSCDWIGAWLNVAKYFDPYGEWDLNPIHLTYILEIKKRH
jgi:hypothetical protein